ncbi:Shprh, partial [Symbiodinium pilosum]
VPPAAREWQLPLDLPSDAVKPVEDEPWLLQIHPRKQTLRVLLRPGVLLLQMVRRGTALPAARFTWRIIDSHTKEKEERPADDRACAHPVGEFSILSNLE